MENKNIIIILIVIIFILAAAIGFMVVKPMHAKEPTKIKITSNKTLNERDNLSVKLTDLNKTPLSQENVNITIKDSKGKVVVNKTVKTNDYHFYENGQEYVGDPNRQHLTIEMHNYVKEHGMGD